MKNKIAKQIMNYSIKIPHESIKILGNLEVVPMFELDSLINNIYINDKKAPKLLAEYILIGVFAKIDERVSGEIYAKI